MNVHNLNVNNFVNQISNASNKDKIGWGGDGMTLTTGASFKERISWKQPSKNERQQIAQTFLNALNRQVNLQNMGPKAREIGVSKFNKLVKKIVNDGLSVKSAKQLINNLVRDKEVNRWHPFKALGKLIGNLVGYNSKSQVRDINEHFMRGLEYDRKKLYEQN